MEQLGPHWTDYCVFWYLGMFQKSVEKIHVSLKSDKGTFLFMEKMIINVRINPGGTI